MKQLVVIKNVIKKVLNGLKTPKPTIWNPDDHVVGFWGHVDNIIGDVERPITNVDGIVKQIMLENDNEIRESKVGAIRPRR